MFPNRNPATGLVLIALAMLTASVPAWSADPHTEYLNGRLPYDWQASIVLQVKGKAVRERGITLSDISKQVKAFFAENREFDLVELQRLEIVAPTGKFKLKDLIKLRVKFRRAEAAANTRKADNQDEDDDVGYLGWPGGFLPD